MMGPGIVGAAMVAAMLTGCAQDREVLELGDVQLQWAVGPRGCQDAGTRELWVTTDVAVEGVPSTGWRFHCEARRGRIAPLPAGVYRFRLAAVGPDGTAWFDGATEAVQVRPGGTSLVPPVVLQARPARWTLRWNFGGPLCSQVDVAEVEVFAFDGWGTVEGQGRAACEQGMVELHLRPGSYDVVIQATSPSGDLRFERILERTLLRGEDVQDDVSLLGNPWSEDR
jgi:hypothetical protein